jgi:ribosomal protein S27AE
MRTISRRSSIAMRLVEAYCRVVGHTGDWVYPDARCSHVRICSRCGDVTSKQTHMWTGFEYVATDRCDQQRRCQRCGRIESRVLHAYGPWRYVGPDSFLLKLQQVHTCGRCGVEEQLEFERAF